MFLMLCLSCSSLILHSFCKRFLSPRIWLSGFNLKQIQWQIPRKTLKMSIKIINREKAAKKYFWTNELSSFRYICSKNFFVYPKLDILCSYFCLKMVSDFITIIWIFCKMVDNTSSKQNSSALPPGNHQNWLFNNSISNLF